MLSDLSGPGKNASMNDRNVWRSQNSKNWASQLSQISRFCSTEVFDLEGIREAVDVGEWQCASQLACWTK